MAETSLLLSFVGNRDPYVESSEDFGPVLSLLQARPFDRVILFCTGPAYLERAKMVEEVCRGFGCAASFRQSNAGDSPLTSRNRLLGRGLLGGW